MIWNYLRIIIIMNRLKFNKTSNCSLQRIDFFSRKISRLEAQSHSKERINSNSEREWYHWQWSEKWIFDLTLNASHDVSRLWWFVLFLRFWSIVRLIFSMSWKNDNFDQSSKKSLKNFHRVSMIRFIFISLLRFLLIWWASFWKSCHSTMNWFKVTFDDQIWSFTTYSRKETSSSSIACRLKNNWSTTDFCVWYFSCEDKMIRNWIMLVTLKKRWSLRLTRNKDFVNDNDILTINWKENNSKNESER
jgi:hypothetical protein